MSVKNVDAYRYLKPEHASRARQFFENRAVTRPHLAWMEGVFLDLVQRINTGQMPGKVDPAAIEPVSLGSPYLDSYANFGKKEERFRDIGSEALKQGYLMPVVLAGGMATGFGGGAKGAVDAWVDARYENEKGISYLAIKWGNFLSLQRESGHHLIAAAMVSDETRDEVKKTLKKFVKDQGAELVVIDPGTSRQEIEAIWKKYRDHWNTTIILPLILQPSSLLIGKDGKSVGGEYMKGHGDFYQVVQSQLKDVVEVTGARYLFVSNIDNTGALVSRSILGYFVEKVQNEKIESMVEVAEKYEGDKGGVPALVRRQFSILEGGFVPDEKKNDFLGRDVFPFFNTNTLWYLAQAVFDRDFPLPPLPPPIVKQHNEEFLKIETIIGNGLDYLRAVALVIDRGQRFCPAKYLSDLWIGRTDWMRVFRGRLLPVMHDGQYVLKPLVITGKGVFPDVATLNNLFGHGSYDSMVDLTSMLIGGERNRFNDCGKLSTSCGVRYLGDVAVIFEYREGKPPATLIINGAEADTITFKDSILYVPTGTPRVISAPVTDQVEMNRAEFEAVLRTKDIVDRWPASQIRRIRDKFFPELTITPKLVTLDDLAPYARMLDPVHRGQFEILRKVFTPAGSLVYEVEFKENPDKHDPEKYPYCKDGLWPYMHVVSGSKRGMAEHYPSRVDDKWDWAMDHKGQTIVKTPQEIYVDAIDESKGKVVKGLYSIAVPYREDNHGKIYLIIGAFNEEYNPDEKIRVFAYRLNSLIATLADPNRTVSKEDKARIRELFKQIPWPDLFLLATQKLYDKHIGPVINPEKYKTEAK